MMVLLDEKSRLPWAESICEAEEEFFKRFARGLMIGKNYYSKDEEMYFFAAFENWESEPVNELPSGWRWWEVNLENMGELEDEEAVRMAMRVLTEDEAKTGN